MVNFAYGNQEEQNHEEQNRQEQEEAFSAQENQQKVARPGSKNGGQEIGRQKGRSSKGICRKKEVSQKEDDESGEEGRRH